MDLSLQKNQDKPSCRRSTREAPIDLAVQEFRHRQLPFQSLAIGREKNHFVLLSYSSLPHFFLLLFLVVGLPRAAIPTPTNFLRTRWWIDELVPNSSLHIPQKEGQGTKEMFCKIKDCRRQAKSIRSIIIAGKRGLVRFECGSQWTFCGTFLWVDENSDGMYAARLENDLNFSQYRLTNL